MLVELSLLRCSNANPSLQSVQWGFLIPCSQSDHHCTPTLQHNTEKVTDNTNMHAVEKTAVR